MKPVVDGFNETLSGGNYYDGPPPTPGLYQGKIKQLALATIASGPNAGGQRLHLVVEITDGKPAVVDSWTISEPVPLPELLN